MAICYITDRNLRGFFRNTGDGLLFMEKDTKKLFKSLTHLSSIGLVMAVCIAIGGLLGLYLDRKFGTAPILLIVCFLLGVAAAFKNLYTLYKKMQENEK